MSAKRDDDSGAGSDRSLPPTDAELWRAFSEGSDSLLILDSNGNISWENRNLRTPDDEPPIGRSAVSLVSEAERPAFEDVLQRLRAGGPEEAGTFDFDALPAPKAFDCHFIPIRRAGRLIALLVHARDVTAERLHRAELATNEEKFRALVETSPDALCLFDEAGVIHYANPAAHRLLGRDAFTLFGVDGWNLIHPDDHAAILRIREEIHARPGESLEVPRWRVLHQDGSWRWIENVATNLLQLPSVAAVVGTYRDVTARMELEEQLRQAQKMEAIGLLTGGVAHDFNNLLTVILASVDHATQDLPAGHPALEDLSTIARVSLSAAELTQKLLTFARRQVYVPVRFDLRQTVVGFGALLRRMVEETVSIAIEAPDPLPLDGDPGQLQQLLLNLVTNAKQAMPNGGALRLVARRIEPTSEYPFGCARLEVFDTGVGMDEETRAKLFEPFFTTRLGGTGLGMSVVANVVQDHRGSIGIDSEPGRGTTVWVELPLCAAV